MILEQNYIKIIEYTQKAFKIFCRRSLGAAIIKSLQKKHWKQKQRLMDEEEVNINLSLNQRNSQRNITQIQGLRQQSIQTNSAISEAKKTINNIERYQVTQKNYCTDDRHQIMYGDLVYIELISPVTSQNMRAKYFLNKLRFCQIDMIGVGTSSDLRCVFQIIQPGSTLSLQKKNILVTQSSLISFRSISKKQYLKVKQNKIAYSDKFGKQLQLCSQLSEGCVFQLKNTLQYISQQNIVSGTPIIIKLFRQQLFMNVLQEQFEAFFSQTPLHFSLKKLSKKTQSFTPLYYKLKSNKFDTSILGNPIDLETISQKKLIANVVAVNQKNDQIKINPITFIQYDFTKILEQELRITSIKEGYMHNILNCWQLIEDTRKHLYKSYYLYNPILSLGLTIKMPPKNLIRLTPNYKDFTILRLNRIDQELVFFTVQQSQQQLDVIYDREAQKHIMILSKACAQNQSKKIKIKQIDTKICYMICQMNEVLEVLKGVYQFLDVWGNQVDDKSEVIYYSVKEIKLGSSTMLKKIKQMRIVMKIIKNYLQNPQYSVQQIQNTINFMKILEMIINICKVITNKIGYTNNQINISESDPLYLKSPFCFAKNNLQDILKQIFALILKLTKDNYLNSNCVIQQVSFFNIVLVYYPEQIGQILQQSIKNLSVFTSKSNNTSQSIQLLLWVKLIEPVKQKTIRIQKTYIDIISEVVIDPNDKGIAIYQNRYKQLLFIQNSKKKAIPKFGIQQESKKPIIIFESYSSLSDFFKNNNYLSKLNLVHLNSASYFIEQFYMDRYCPQSEICQQYLNYIGSIIKMFRNLSRNRNKKLLKIVDDWGITQQHIHSIFNQKKISWNLKSNYLSLWSVIYFDEDPFLRFQKRESKCHYWKKIAHYNLHDCTALIFKQYTDESLAVAKLNEASAKIYPILSDFFLQFKRKAPNNLSDVSSLKCFLDVLKTVHQIIDLGYMSLKAIKYYIVIILHSLSGLDDKNFLKKAGEQQIQKLHHAILIKFVQILILYEDIWVEIYGIQFLVNFYRESQKKNFNTNFEEMQQKWQHILKCSFEQNQDAFNLYKAQSNGNRKRTRFNAYSETDTNIMHDGSVDFINLNNSLSFQEADNQILDFAVNLLVKRMLQNKCQSQQKLIRLINKKKTRRVRICSYLKEIVILNNQKQQNIYKNFSGRQSNKLLNSLKIQQLVLKIAEIESDSNLDEVEEKCKKQKILQLNNILVKIIRQIKRYKDESLDMLKKCQVILQKLNVHIVLLQLLKYSEKPTYKELIKSTMEYFKQLMIQNQMNCKKLVPHTVKFTKNMNFEGSTFLLPKLIKINENKQEAYKIVYDLIYKVNSNQASNQLLIIIDQLLSPDWRIPHQQQLKNHLSKRILEQFNLRNILQQQVLAEGKQQFQIFYVLQLFKIICKLCPTCPQLEKNIKSIYSKCELLQKIKQSEDFNHKKLYLKILTQIYVKDKQLQNFQIQDFLQVLVIKQIKKLPSICIKPIQKKAQINEQKRSKIQKLFQQLLPSKEKKIQTKQEQVYLNYIYDILQPNQISILKFCQIIINKWKFTQKSKRLLNFRSYFRKLEQFLQLIFNEESSSYQRNMFQTLQQINIKMQDIVLQYMQNFTREKVLDQSSKEQVIKFYQSLSKILVEQKLSVNLLFSIFKIDPKKLQLKRSNSNFIFLIPISDFIKSLLLLRENLKKQNQISKMIDGVSLFRFLNASKDYKTKKIDIYYFMEKLISVIEYNKNILLKQQIYGGMNQSQQIQEQNAQASINFNVYEQSENSNEKQFSVRVQTFCQVSKRFQESISNVLNRKIKQSINSLSKRLVDEWATDANLNVLSISQFYERSFLLPFVINMLHKINDYCQFVLVSQNFSKSIYQYLKLMAYRFNNKLDINILILYYQILTNFCYSSFLLQKFQRYAEKAYDKVIQLVLERKSQQNIKYLKFLKILFVQLLNNPQVVNSFKLNMKIKIALTIKKFISQRIDVSCFYDYKILQYLFVMWSENQPEQDIQSSRLLQDSCFIEWIHTVFNKKYFREVIGANSKNVIKCKFGLLITKMLIKYLYNYNNYNTNLRKWLLKIQPSVNQIHQKFVIPKDEAYRKQKYCLGSHQCSQFFCNYQNKLTQQDENVLNLLLSIFILTRICLGKSEVRQQLQLKQNWKNKKNQYIKQLIGNIRYKLYNKSKSYNFKLPYCYIFNNKQIEKKITREMESLPKQSIYMYFHPLSRVFYKELTLYSFIQNKIYVFKFLFSHRSLIRRLIILFFSIIAILDFNTDLLKFPSQISSFEYPVIKIFCLIAIFIKTTFLFQQLYFFFNKCKYYLPFKYSQLNKNTSYQLQNQFSKSFGETNINKISQINENEPLRRTSNFKNHFNDKSSQALIIKKRHILVEFIKSPILLQITHLIFYVMALKQSNYVVILLILQGISIQQTQNILKGIYTGIIQSFYYALLFTFINLSCLIFFLTSSNNDPYNSSQVLYSFLVSYYEASYLGNIEQQELNTSQKWFLAVSAISLFLAYLISAYFIADSIYKDKSRLQLIRQKCWICGRSKNQFQNIGQNFEFHISNQHKLWDYFYFFIQFDRGNKLQGIQTQIYEQIQNGDYGFINFF